MRALIPEFNAVILRLAPAFTAAPKAPETFRQLMQARAETRALLVWEGASEATVYGDARVNHAFRAWHDATHIAGGHGFTLEGERATYRDQWAAVLSLYPSAPDAWRALLHAEIIRQAEHYEAHGAFPTDQAAFIREALSL